MDTDHDFLAAVERGDEPVGHASNLRLAALLVQLHGEEAAASTMLELIARRVERRGGVVHVTKTLAWVRLVAATMTGEGDVDRLLAAQPRLADSRLLEVHYDPATLAGEVAHRSWVEPDRLPLPRRTALLAG